MKIRIPLFLKMMAPLVLLIVLVVGISGYRVYRESTDRWQAEMDERLERVATLLATTIDRDALRRVQLPVDLDNNDYTAVKRQLEQALTAGNLAWIGIYYYDDARLYYWVDSDSTGVGYPFFYATPQHFAAFRDQTLQRIQYEDEFGSYYGFVAPILVGDEGQQDVLGLVEVVLHGEARELLQRDTLSRVLPIMLGGSAVAIALSALIAMVLFNRPLRRLQRGALVLANGQFGYTVDLPSRDEMGELASAFNLMSTQLERLYRERAESERIQREIEIARTVQQALFPKQIPQASGFEVAAYCRPHRETSGDFYDIMLLSDGQIGIMVGDVSGKSIPAAMLMVAAHSTIRSEAYDHDSPGVTLSQSNAMLCRNVPRGMFVAASYARLNAAQRSMVWANAGQIYPFLLHRTPPVDLQDYPHYLETTGISLPMGMNAIVRYDDQYLQLLPGDMVLFYTDGVIEAMNIENELYGFERLERLVRSLPLDMAPQQLIDAVLADVAAFVGTADQHDDITIVAVKFVND